MLTCSCVKYLPDDDYLISSRNSGIELTILPIAENLLKERYMRMDNDRRPAKAIIKDLIAQQGTQTEFAIKMGYKAQSGISSVLAQDNMQVNTLLKIAHCLGYELVLTNGVNVEKIGE